MVKWISMMLAIFTVSLVTTSAQASIITPYLEEGVNLFEDDSGDIVLRFDDDPQSPSFGTYIPVTSGQIEQNDIFVMVLDISWINNSTNVLEPGSEVTGVMIMSVAGITDVTAESIYFTGDIDFVAVDPLLTSALLGVTASAGDVAFFFEDSNNNLSISTDDALSAIANATDGTSILTAAILDPQDYFEGDDVFLDLAAYGVGTPGVSLRGNFEAGLSVSSWNLDGLLVPDSICDFDDCYDLGISGTLLATDLDGFAIQDDAQFSFGRKVPEPAPLALLGLGLIGMAAARRRKQAS